MGTGPVQVDIAIIGFTDHRELPCCEIATFRYRVLHVAARITRGAVPGRPTNPAAD
jgi:hypothetical protein